MNRRQELLTKARYIDFLVYSQETKEFWVSNTFESDTPEQEASLRATHFKNVALKKLLISYTAGLADLGPINEPLPAVYVAVNRVFKPLRTPTPSQLHTYSQHENCFEEESTIRWYARFDQTDPPSN